MEKWKQHLGVYGIYNNNEKLLVIRKTRGPYINRFDLPGGSFDENESITQCLVRELQEEIGHTFYPTKMIGTYDYLIPWKIKEFTHLHHLATYFEIESSKELKFESVVADDSAGYEMVSIDTLTESNASPLVMEAVNYLKENSTSYNLKRYDDWKPL